MSAYKCLFNTLSGSVYLYVKCMKTIWEIYDVYSARFSTSVNFAFFEVWPLAAKIKHAKIFLRAVLAIA